MKLSLSMKGKIYRLVDAEGYFYIGSTTKRLLCQRMSQHRYDSRNHPERSPYTHFNTAGFDTVKIELLKEIECETFEEVLFEERLIMEEHIGTPKCLNVKLPIFNDEERRVRGAERALARYYKRKSKFDAASSNSAI